MSVMGEQFSPERVSLRGPVRWGLALGAAQAASPLLFPWLEQATVQALYLSLIAAVYIGFAVADGRPKVIAVEAAVAAAFFLIAAVSVRRRHGCSCSATPVTGSRITGSTDASTW